MTLMNPIRQLSCPWERHDTEQIPSLQKAKGPLSARVEESAAPPVSMPGNANLQDSDVRRKDVKIPEA